MIDEELVDCLEAFGTSTHPSPPALQVGGIDIAGRWGFLFNVSLFENATQKSGKNLINRPETAPYDPPPLYDLSYER